MYLNCPRCRLSIRMPRAASIAPQHCPRCTARLGVASPLFSSSMNMRELAGEEPGSPDLTGLPPLRGREEMRHGA
jgi:hypothetical protein